MNFKDRRNGLDKQRKVVAGSNVPSCLDGLIIRLNLGLRKRKQEVSTIILHI